MPAYYNEIEPFAASWLRNLIAADLIAPGEVDERSIVEVTSDDLRGFTQCHFFAGIGGWSLALRLGGWDDGRPVWTGSCPCQPFSAAGKGLAEADARHFWPEFRRLIAECAPPVVFGEQVASSLGRQWLAGVRADLEVLGYAVGAADLCAAGVGAPHIRQRLWWVADAGSERRQQIAGSAFGDEGTHGRRPEGNHVAASIGQDVRWLADSAPDGRQQVGEDRPGGDERGGAEGRAAGLGLRGAPGPWSDYVWIPCADGKARRIGIDIVALVDGLPDFLAGMRPDKYAEAKEKVTAYGKAKAQRPDQILRAVREAIHSGETPIWPMGEPARVRGEEVLLAYLRELEARCETTDEDASSTQAPQGGMRRVPNNDAASCSPHRREPRQLGAEQHPDALHLLSRLLAQHAEAAWAAHWRANAKPISPLSIGELGRVGRLRAYGNAIVPQVAAQFIRAARDVIEACRP